MGLIRILDESVSNAIAAGEVVENPTSMIKELVENSLDAGSTDIKIEIFKGGLDVVITDNGKGMSKEDLLLSVERHATSKIKTKDDLFSISTYGFRGEALSSIASVSKMKMISKTDEDKTAHQINLLGGKVTNLKEIDAPTGTKIEIRDLFFNTPARLKFLRKEATEYTNIKDVILKEALANYNIKISLYIDGKESIKISGNGIENTIFELFGRNTLKNITAFTYGYVGNSELYRSSRDNIFTFVNGRMVKSKLIEDAVIDAYYTRLMKNKYPFAIIFLDIDPSETDVNVHPSKKIIKFSNNAKVYSCIKEAVLEVFSLEKDFSYANFADTNRNEAEEIVAEDFAPYRSENFNVDNFYENDKNLTEKKFETLKMEKNSFAETDTSFLNNVWNEKKFYEDEKNEDSVIKNVDHTEKNGNIFDERNLFFVKDRSKIPFFRVIGQLFDTFILVERDGVFEIYDQHIIHERVLYEKLKSDYRDKKISSQQLLVPIRISVTVKEKSVIEENLALFQNFGFEIDAFGQTEMLIREVPTFNFRDSYENTVRYIVDNILNDKNVDVLENVLISMSCKGAIKANHNLSFSEMIDMVAKIHEVGVYTCPHGRPIIAQINKNDMEKLFKRK